MSVEIPYDLIKEVQIAVLKETNLSSYDPDDAWLPNLPSLESSISELDPSPPNLRCNHCKGRLLRGVGSLICVFCGKQQVQQDAPPEPINFKSTFGCHWLLQSLALDGTEIAGLPFKVNESNIGRNTTEKEFKLSDFLDLEIKWHPELEKVETESNKSPLNLVGVNLDTFFYEGKKDIVSEEQLAEDQNDSGSGNNDFQVRDNLTFFENVQHSEPSVRSVEDERGGGSFNGWEANFQSAGDGNSCEESKSSDLVLGSSIDLSAHVDAVFGSEKTFGENKENIGSSASKTNDWFQDDPWSGSNSLILGESKQVETIHEEDNSFDAWNDFTSSTTVEHPSNIGETKQFEVTAIVKDGGEAEKVNNSSSRSIYLVQDEQLQINNIERPYNKAIGEKDESQDVWNDFASSTSVQDSSNGQTGHAKQFEVSTNLKDGEMSENAKISSFMSVDGFQDNQWQTTANKAPANKTIDVDDNMFDAWNDFTSSTSVQDISTIQTGQGKQFEVSTNFKDGEILENAKISSFMNVDGFQDNQWETTNKSPDNKTIDVDDDLFDVWNDFTSSTSAQDPSKSQTGQAKQSEVTASVKDDRMVENANNSTSIAWIQDDDWPTSSKKTSDTETINEGYDLFDSWNHFTSSTSAQDFPNKQTEQTKQSKMTANVGDHGIMEVNNSSFDWFQGDQGQISSNKNPGDKTTNEGYDSFDVWNGFTTSTGAHDPSNKQSVSYMAPSVEQTSEIKFVATNNNLQNDDFGRFSQAHFFSGAFSDQNGSKDVNIMKSEPSMSDRATDVNAKGGGNAGEAAKLGDVSNATTRSTIDDVEMLMSQMHDLSFMVASDLSISSKPR